MAITDNNPNNTAQQAQPQQTQTGNNTWGMFGLGTIGGLSRNATSEVLTKTVTALKDVLIGLNVQKPYSLSVIPLDKAKQTNLHLSGIVVAVTVNQAAVAYHTLILEGSGDALQPRIENVNGKQVQIDRLTSDVYDKDYQATVDGIMQEQFGGMNMLPVSGQIVPRNFNLEDKAAVLALAKNAIFPPMAKLSTRVDGFQDMDLTKFNGDSRLQVTLGFNDSDAIDYVGRPVRSSATVTLVANSVQKANANGINTDQKQITISRVSGFIDQMWAPVETQNNPYQPQQNAIQPKFVPRFVITDMQNSVQMTLAAQLLALVSSITISEGTNWYPYYKPRASVRGVDLRDIGAINIEGNVFNDPSGIGQRIDTKSASFGDMELGKLLHASVRPNMVMSLDVSDCGSDTWYSEVFAAAASGHQGATKAIIDAANTLTGGHFGRHFQNNNQVVVQDDDRIHMGYYTNADGQKTDIREVDHLAVCNMIGEKDPGAAKDWSETFLNIQYPIIQRLDARRKMICDIVRSEITFTGYARRVTYLASFLGALASGCRDAGLEMTLNSPHFGVNYQSQRNVFTGIQMSGMSNTASGMFNQGYLNNQGYVGNNFSAQRNYAY